MFLYAKEIELMERHFTNGEVVTDELTTEQVVNEIAENETYKPNLKEILAIYFEQNPKAKAEWIAWLGGK